MASDRHAIQHAAAKMAGFEAEADTDEEIEQLVGMHMFWEWLREGGFQSNQTPASPCYCPTPERHRKQEAA